MKKQDKLTLEGDLATVAEEITNQVGSAADFGAMNVIQQQALAKAMGMQRGELAGYVNATRRTNYASGYNGRRSKNYG